MGKEETEKIIGEIGEQIFDNLFQLKLPFLSLITFYCGPEEGVYTTHRIVCPKAGDDDEDARQMEMAIYSSMLAHAEANCLKLRHEGAERYGPEFLAAVDRDIKSYVAQLGLPIKLE